MGVALVCRAAALAIDIAKYDDRVRCVIYLNPLPVNACWVLLQLPALPEFLYRRKDSISDPITPPCLVEAGDTHGSWSMRR